MAAPIKKSWAVLAKSLKKTNQKLRKKKYK